MVASKLNDFFRGIYRINGSGHQWGTNISCNLSC